MTATTVAASEPVREDTGFAPPLMFIVGSLLADRIWSVVAGPKGASVLALTTLAGIVVLALTGIVDLTLRARIP